MKSDDVWQIDKTHNLNEITFGNEETIFLKWVTKDALADSEVREVSWYWNKQQVLALSDLAFLG
jgi:hypothetical protein